MRIVADRVRALFVGVTATITMVAVQAHGSFSPRLSAAQVSVGPAAQAPAESPKGTGLLLGQVVAASGGGPIAGATVTITGGSQSVTLPTGEVVVTSSGPIPGGVSAASGAPRQVITDSTGRFMFRDLSKGRYTIRAASPGSIGGAYGQNSPTGTPQSIELSRDDEKRGDLIVRLWKSATVAGTVIDETGEPVVGYTVRWIRRLMTGGRLRLSPGTSVTTDDRGVYRMSNLIPGDYLVAIMSTQTTMPISTADDYMQQMSSGGSLVSSDIYRELNSSGAPSPSMAGYRVGDLVLQANASGRSGGSAPLPAPTDDGKVFTYPSVFYPAASVLSQATVLSLASGQERSGVDFQLKLMPSVRVSGTVMGPEGPARNFGVKLFPAGAEEFTTDSGIEAASTATDASGSFTFLGVTPGEYILKGLRVPRALSTSSSSMTMIEVSGPNGMIMGMSSSNGATAPPPPLPTEPSLWATMPVSVGERDLAGLSVALRPGARVGGRIVFEGTREPPSPDQVQRASIQINPVGGSTSIQFLLGPKRVETDGRFSSVGFPPGRYMVSASMPGVLGGAPGTAPGSAPTWTLKSATRGGRDVSDEGLEIGAEDVSDIVMTFTDRTTELSGTVLDAKGQPDKGASVVILPADSQAWKQGVMNARRLRSIRTTTLGGYSVANLPPGDYLVAAVSTDTLGEWQDPKVLEKVAAVATRFTLGDGEKKAQALSTRTIR
jgi:hypothetical protein